MNKSNWYILYCPQCNNIHYIDDRIILTNEDYYCIQCRIYGTESKLDHSYLNRIYE